MAEETVVKETLTKEMIEAGADLTRSLDLAQVPVSASFWLYLSESNVWRLVIASPEVGTSGSRDVYQKVQAIISRLPQDRRHIELRDISVAEKDSLLIELLRKAIRTGSGIAGIRFSRNTIDGHYVEDTYIYRVT